MTKQKSGKLVRREKITALVFVSPLIIGFIVFTLVCMIISFGWSFTNFNPISGRMKFDGWGQYVDLFTHPTYKKAFLDSILNTLFLLLSIPVSIIISVLIAALMNSKKFKGKTVFRVIIYLPAVTSVVAVNYIWRYMFEENYGLINAFFHAHIPWLTDETLVKVAMIIKNVWSGIGTQVILFMAGMQNISDEYYEAAELDGAGPVYKFLHITLPLVTPVLFYTIITGLIGGFQMFADVELFAGGHYGARTIVFFIRNYGIGQNLYGLASAASFLLAAIIMIITALQFKFNKWVEYTD
ncbi:MAG: sugar ABC transporter permease [Clostridia bacterium]|nr:sugar ABC transporter permease [Clostridia bacterium]